MVMRLKFSTVSQCTTISQHLFVFLQTYSFCTAPQCHIGLVQHDVWCHESVSSLHCRLSTWSYRICCWAPVPAARRPQLSIDICPQGTQTSLDLNDARDGGVWGSSGISWTICKQSAPRPGQITTPTPYHSIFTGRVLFLTPNQQCQSTEGIKLLS